MTHEILKIFTKCSAERKENRIFPLGSHTERTGATSFRIFKSPLKNFFVPLLLYYLFIIIILYLIYNNGTFYYQ